MKRVLLWLTAITVIAWSSVSLEVPYAAPPDAFAPDEEGVVVLTLRDLGSWPLEMPRYDDPDLLERINGQVPAAIRELDGHVVEVDGFVMPFAFDGRGAVTRFLLVPHMGACCFGGGARFNQMIDVTLDRAEQHLGGTRPHRVRGTLRVGAGWDEEGHLTGLYTIEARRVRPLRRGWAEFRR